MQLFVTLLRLIVKINKNKAINRKIVIQLKDINKTYNNGAPLHVLKGINLDIQVLYLQPIITQYFIDNKSEIWLLFLIAHSKR